MRASIALLLLPMFIGGCAVWSPQIRIAPEKLGGGTVLYGSLPGSIDRANIYIDKYLDAVQDHTHLKNSAALILTPLAAVALYKGMAGNPLHDHNRLALGLGGASLYLGGGMFYSRPKQRIYLEGARAMGCAIAINRSYLIKIEDFNNIAAGKEKIAIAAQAVDDLVNRINSGAGDDRRLDTDWDRRLAVEVNAAESLVARSGEVIDASSEYQYHIEVAGSRLDDNVRVINHAVSVELEKVDADWSELAKLSQGIGTSLAAFHSSQPASPTADTSLSDKTGMQNNLGDKQARESRAAAWERLQGWLNELAGKTAALSQSVNAQNRLLQPLVWNQQFAVEVAKECYPSYRDERMEIMPETPLVILSEEKKSHKFTVKNGRLNWPPEGAGEYLELQQSDGAYTIRLRDAVLRPETVKTRLVVTADKGNQEKGIDLTLQARPKPAATGGTAGAGTTASGATADTAAGAPAARSMPGAPVHDKAVVECVQRAIGMADASNGLPGPQTSLAIAAYAKAKGMPGNTGFDGILAKLPQCQKKNH
jgi:hypothetical protein